jgi:acetyl esterase/lipase
MSSWQAHALDLIMRAQIKWRLREGISIEQARAVLDGTKLAAPPGVTYRPDTIGGLPGEWAEAATPKRGTLLYLHGGGYFACSPQTYRPITGAYAKRGFAVFTPDYRLAPEHPYPAAIEDAEAAWNGLLAAGHDAGSLVVSGDSAGGGLTLALLLTLRDKGAPLPAAAALLSPWTDLAITGASMTTNAGREAMFRASGLHQAAAAYLAGAEAKTPLASPLYADLAGLPPLLIHAGDREILRDDSTRLAAAARAAGVPVTLRIWPVVPHVWQLAIFVPETRESLDEMAGFLHAARDAAEAAG